MEAVVLGGTGLVGKILVEKLISQSNYSKIIVIARKPIEFKSKKIENILIINLSEIIDLKLKLGPSVFFCCLGSTIKQAGSKENFKKVDFTIIGVRVA